MLHIRQGGMALALTGLLLVQAGCVGPTASLTTAALPSVPEARDELPKDKAIQTSLSFARNLDKSGSDDAAIEQYEKVLRLSPDHPEATRRLAVLYDRRADFSSAEAAYKKLAKMRPRDADLMCDWGYSYYLRNNWKDAEAKLRRALDLDKQHARARCNLGLVLGQQDRFDEAYQMFRQAGLDEADAHCDLAFVFWTRGPSYYERARRECIMARQINPACSKAQELLTQIDAARQPRSERLAARTTAPEQTPRAPTTSEERHQKYPLPPGWAPVPVKPAVPETTSATRASQLDPVPTKPFPSTGNAVGQGTVTFD
ncbi:MAG TPA: tetratricopeptide repeat protein [Gemmataceae bacterium]|nr:tetratricopeptide repeat protein [Gemmataceae bacterium]